MKHFFFHQFSPVAVQNRFQPFMDPLTRDIQRDCGKMWTDVLMRCECGKLKTESIEGTWSLEQIKDGAA